MSRLRTTFPDREFIMRSQGQVRFVKISTKMQVVAAGVLVLLAITWITAMAFAAVSRYTAERERLTLLDREAKVTTAESRLSNYREGIESVADDLARRQKFIENMVEAHIGTLPASAQAGETVSDSSSEAARTVNKVSAAIPEAAGLARIEAQQLAFVESLTRYADRRSAQAAELIRGVGLNPATVLASVSGRSDMGGPFLRLATDRDGSLDPRFARMGMSLARMEGLERALAGIPQVHPTAVEAISSGFGYRSDPINGGAAFHAGMDFKGPVGTPIYAAAAGKIVHAGRKAGYGNCIEVNHGNGLMTRYAHLSRIGVRAGQKVAAGGVIGALGNTGRSTGPHLHFEVRVHDRAVNPRPFLENAHNVRQEVRNGA